MRLCTAILILGIFAVIAAAQEVKRPAMTQLDDHDTFRVARLTPSEQKQVFEEIEPISYDTPDSWESELRVRRLPIGGSEEALVLQGSSLLCGATGNCATFVLRHVNSKWIAMFDQQVPIASGFGFASESSKGIKDLVIVANLSADLETIAVYKFDGKVYRPSACYEKTKAQTKTVACK